MKYRVENNLEDVQGERRKEERRKGERRRGERRQETGDRRSYQTLNNFKRLG